MEALVRWDFLDKGEDVVHKLIVAGPWNQIPVKAKYLCLNTINKFPLALFMGVCEEKPCKMQVGSIQNT